MSDAIMEVTERKERAPYIRFETVTEEDIPATRAMGRFVGKDVDYALITPPYSRDINKHKLPQYWELLKSDVEGGRFRREWYDDWMKKYETYKQGKEIPPDGVPVRGWGVISPAQQETLIRMNILTVEDVAGMNDEGIKRIGMGAIELRTKAKAWLAQMNDKGPLTIEVADLTQKNAVLEGQVKTLTEQVQKLMAMVPRQDPRQYQEPADVQSGEISASDIIDDEPVAPTRKRAKRDEATL